MPFTGSHVAAVLPLVRGPLPASALVVGSMVPDAPYYVPLPVGPGLTHSAMGVVSADVVLGLAVVALWHGVLAAPAVAAAPPGLRARLAGVPLGLRRRIRGPGWAGLLPVGVAVGAATHVGWDEFTHAGRWGPRHVAVLARDLGPLPGYRWAQFASTVLGGAVVGWWLVRWWRRHPPPSPAGPDRGRWRGAVYAVLCLAGVLGAAGGVLRAHQPGVRAAVFEGVTGAGSGTLAVALVLAVGWHLMRRLEPAGSR